MRFRTSTRARGGAQLGVEPDVVEAGADLLAERLEQLQVGGGRRRRPSWSTSDAERRAAGRERRAGEPAARAAARGRRAAPARATARARSTAMSRGPRRAGARRPPRDRRPRRDQRSDAAGEAQGAHHVLEGRAQQPVLVALHREVVDQDDERPEEPVARPVGTGPRRRPGRVRGWDASGLGRRRHGMNDGPPGVRQPVGVHSSRPASGRPASAPAGWRPGGAALERRPLAGSARAPAQLRAHHPATTSRSRCRRARGARGRAGAGPRRRASGPSPRGRLPDALLERPLERPGAAGGASPPCGRAGTARPSRRNDEVDRLLGDRAARSCTSRPGR